MSTGGRMRWMTIALSRIMKGEREKSDDATARRLGVSPLIQCILFEGRRTPHYF